MKLIKRQPGQAAHLNTMFDHFFNDDFLNWPASNVSRKWNNMPPANISENDDEYKVELAVPGMQKEDFKISLDQNILSISSEKNMEEKDEKANFSHMEFQHYSFTRTFHLPENRVAEEDVRASYENGVLSIALPKKPEAKKQSPKMIEIA
ncbi:MAG: Hsp20/alpha crystallin family protein [Owenweeksia sp.]